MTPGDLIGFYKFTSCWLNETRKKLTKQTAYSSIWSFDLFNKLPIFVGKCSKSWETFYKIDCILSEFYEYYKVGDLGLKGIRKTSSFVLESGTHLLLMPLTYVSPMCSRYGQRMPTHPVTTNSPYYLHQVPRPSEAVLAVGFCLCLRMA